MKIINKMKVKHIEYSLEDVVRIFRLDRVSKEEIQAQCFDFRFYPRKFGMRLRLDESSSVILEEAKRTLTPREVNVEMKTAFYFGDWQMASKTEANNVEILLLFSVVGNNKKTVIEALNNFGWFLVGEGNVTLDNRNWFVLTFTPMFQEDISSVLKEMDKIFHWTPQYAIEKIKSEGLVPKSEKKRGDHPDAVYFFSDNVNIPEIINFGRELCIANKDSRNNWIYALLSVNTYDVRNIPFYYDPFTERSFYTKDKIDPNIIHIEAIYNFKTNNFLNTK